MLEGSVSRNASGKWNGQPGHWKLKKKQATRKNRFIVIGSWLPCMLGPWERAKKKTNVCTNCAYPPPLPKFVLKNSKNSEKFRDSFSSFYIVLLYACKGTVICFIGLKQQSSWPANIRQESSFPNTWLLDRHVLVPSQPRSRHLVKSCMGPKRHSPVNGLQHNHTKPHFCKAH